MVTCGAITSWQPVVERTRLRFPELAQGGWLYLSNTYQNIGHNEGKQRDEILRCQNYHRVFEPEDMEIRFDLPAYGGAEFSHIVLPASAPIFARSGDPELTAALTAEFSADNAAWASTVQVYTWYFAGVTHKRFPQMAQDGWLWVLDAGFRHPEREYHTSCRKIFDHCMNLSYLQPTQVKACPELGHYPFGTPESALGFLVPVFIRSRISRISRELFR